MPESVCVVLAVIFAIAATVCACILIMPEKKVSTLNKFWYFIHRLINFKSLLIEKILKVLYVFSTAYVILLGFFMLFGVQTYSFMGIGYGGGQYMGGYGILIMILGPIAIRLAYETIMMFIILVNNTNSIKNKLIDDEKRNQPEVKSDAKPNYMFCTKCGTRYDANEGGCPNCDKTNEEPQE